MKPVDPDDTRTMKERLDAGDWYKAGPEQWEAIAKASRLCTEYNNTFPFDAERAVALLPEIFGTAGAVVTKDVPARAVAVGNPARVIKTL